MRRPLVLVLLVLAAACGGSDTSPAAPVACTGERARTVSEGVITVGSDIAYAPFESIDTETQKPVGFDVDLMTEIARRTKRTARFTNQTFDGLITGLISRKFDAVVSAMTITEERRAQICFSEPYFDADQSLVVNAARTPELEGTDDLDGRTVGVQKATTGEAWTNENLKEAVDAIKAYETIDDAFLDLKAGKIHGIVNDIPVNLYRQKLDKDFKVVQTIETGEQYGIAVRPDNKALLDEINTALRDIREDGTYDSIYEKWFGTKP